MLKHLLFRNQYIIRRTLRISSHLFATNTHFPLYPPSSGNMRFYSGASPLEIRFYVFTRYFTPEMGAILLVNEALKAFTSVRLYLTLNFNAHFINAPTVFCYQMS